MNNFIIVLSATRLFFFLPGSLPDGKRLASIGVDNVEEHRRGLRELLFTAPGFEKFCSGVIMFDETLGQECMDGTSFVDLLTSKVGWHTLVY